MTDKFQPMLSATLLNPAALKYPVLASPKFDGIRALVRNGVLVSRNLRPIANPHVAQLFRGSKFEGLDGELIAGEPTDEHVFTKTTSAVMAGHGVPKDVRFFVFDIVSNEAYVDRLATLRELVSRAGVSRLLAVPQRLIKNADELAEFEEKMVGLGYEGVMLRSTHGLYKYGRSTLREGYLCKLKRFSDAEAVITGVVERQHNENEAKRDAVGRIDRSMSKAGMVGANTLGAFLVRGTTGAYKGAEFSVGTGMTDEFRAEVWRDPVKWVGRIIKYKFFPSGTKDAPRFPVFIGERKD